MTKWQTRRELVTKNLPMCAYSAPCAAWRRFTFGSMTHRMKHS